MTSLVLVQQIRDNQCLLRYPKAEYPVDPDAIDGEHLHHREMHDVAVHLTSDLLPGLLYTVPADHVTFNRLNVL